MKHTPLIELLESRTLLASLDECVVGEFAYSDPSGNYSESDLDLHAPKRFATTIPEGQEWGKTDLIDPNGPPASTQKASEDFSEEKELFLKEDLSEREERLFLGKLQAYIESNEIDDPKFHILMKRWSLSEDPTTLLQEKIEIAKRMGHGFLTHGYAINTGYVISLATPLVVACEHSEFLFLQVNAGSTIVAIFCAGLEILDHNFSEALGEAKIDAYEDALESYDHTLTILDQIGNDSLSIGGSEDSNLIIEKKLKEYNSYKSSYILGKELDADAEAGNLVSKTWGYVALSSLAELLFVRNSMKVALAKVSTTPGEMYNDLSAFTRFTALPGLANLISLSNSAIATGLFSGDVWAQYDSWGVHSETALIAQELTHACDTASCSDLERELSLVANLIHESQRPTSQLIGMGWSSLKLTAALSGFIPALASVGWAQQGQIHLAKKFTTWGYLLGSAGFVAQGAVEAGVSQLSEFLWPLHSESYASSIEHSLKADLLKAIDSRENNEQEVKEKMEHLLQNDKEFAIEFLLHHLAKERQEVAEKRLARNSTFKPWELEIDDTEGPVIKFLKNFDHVISDEDFLALFHYSGEADSEALLRRRLNV